MTSNKESIERRAYSVIEAAKVCGLSRATIYRLMDDGKLTSIKIGTRRLIKPDAIDELLRKSVVK